MNKIKYIDGDLLDFPDYINTIMHCANCQNTMGSGIAKQIREKYPVAYNADCFAAKEKKNILGNYSCGHLGDGKLIFNLYGQDMYGRDKRQLNYEAIYSAMEKMRNYFIKEKIYAIIGFPYLMGCDRAGGSWKVVEAMIEDIFGKDDYFDLVCVKYNKTYEK